MSDFPNKFCCKFVFDHNKKSVELVYIEKNKWILKIGDIITDNSKEENFYRYHDIMHLTFLTYFNWSPVFRKILVVSKLLKKRGEPIYEEQDRGRARVIEEAIVLLAFIDKSNGNKIKSKNSVFKFSKVVLKQIKDMTKGLEVYGKSISDWEEVLKIGFNNWNKLVINKGGTFEVDLNKKTMIYSR